MNAGGLGVKRLSEMTGQEMSRVSRMLAVMSESRLVDRDPSTLLFRLGWRFYAMAARAGDMQLRSAGPRFVRLLSNEVGERAHLSVLDGRNVLTIISESSGKTIQAAGWVGRSHPYPYCTSAGRALLLGHSESELETLLGDVEFDPPGPNGPRSFSEFLSRLEAERRVGWVYSDEEFEPGLVGVAAPVFDFDGRVVAALNLSAPKYRAEHALRAAGPRVVEVAAQLSGLVAYSPGPADAGPSRAAG